MISIVLNLLLAGLLCGAIWMGWRLNERLKLLRQGQMGFAKAVADRVIFMDQGQIVEQNTPHEFFNNPQNERSRDFLSKILGH